MEDNYVENSSKWLEDLSKGKSNELEAITLGGVQVLHAREGLISCRFVVSNRVTDGDGNWRAGAMATLIDDVGAAAIYSLVGHLRVSLDFSISYFSTAKIHEEVEVEAKAVGSKGRLTSVIIEARKKDSGELIALGKQWMAENKDSIRISKL